MRTPHKCQCTDNNGPASQSKTPWIWTTGGRWVLPAFLTNRTRTFKSWDKSYGVRGCLCTSNQCYLKQNQELSSYRRSLPPPLVPRIFLSYYWAQRAKYRTPCNNFNCSHSFIPTYLPQLCRHCAPSLPVVINNYNLLLLQLKGCSDGVLAKSQRCFLPLNNMTQFKDSLEFTNNASLRVSVTQGVRWVHPFRS